MSYQNKGLDIQHLNRLPLPDPLEKLLNNLGVRDDVQSVFEHVMPNGNVQWYTVVTGNNVIQVYPDADGNAQFYMISLGEYGQPLSEAEPARSFEAPNSIEYKNTKGETVEPNQPISGIVCRDSTGRVVHRLSLTNAHNKGIEWEIDNQGKMVIGDDTFYLRTLFLKDQNRISGYDAFFGSEPVDHVTIKELEDVV